ncbi:tautomerase family protein [Kiloniella laminariae]|uniref:tautomerase family protein n=1 Tax=Kiloniella laminariae TaxID=454162 RepID=UPI00036958CD|nr:tautomerase family protein [Kiloniella laminariae]
MPLVRISHVQNKPSTYSDALSNGVHQALITAFDIPEDDYFQIITEHLPQQGLRFPEAFLGITHGKEMVFVQITAAAGRTLDQKKVLYQEIVARIHATTGLRKEDVLINLVETSRENWSFGLGQAPFA